MWHPNSTRVGSWTCNGSFTREVEQILATCSASFGASLRTPETCGSLSCASLEIEAAARREWIGSRSNPRSETESSPSLITCELNFVLARFGLGRLEG